MIDRIGVEVQTVLPYEANMKARNGKLVITFNAEAELREWLIRRAAELTIKRNDGKRVPMGNVIIEAIEDYRRKNKK